MVGVPEWTEAEVEAVMALYHERGSLPKWKPIALELQQLNADGALNAALAQKGLYRSNNAVMNKVKEMVFKASGSQPMSTHVCSSAYRRNGKASSMGRLTDRNCELPLC
jgi:hypothetical protein